MPEFNPGGSPSLNAAVAARYEANPDRNAYTGAEKARLARAATLPFVAPAAGQWIGTGQPVTVVQTGTVTADQLRLYPWRPTRDRVCDRIGLFVSTLLAGSTAKIAVYDADPATDRPANLLFESAALDTSTGGGKEGIFPAARTFVGATTYWIGARASGAVGMVLLTQGALPDIRTGGIPTASGMNKIVARTVPIADAAPATWVWSDAEAITSLPPHIALRIA